MKNIKFILPFLSYCLFFMAQAVNAQYYGYEDDLQLLYIVKAFQILPTLVHWIFVI